MAWVSSIRQGKNHLEEKIKKREKLAKTRLLKAGGSQHLGYEKQTRTNARERSSSWKKKKDNLRRGESHDST